MLLHHTQELDNDLGAGPNKDLTSSGLLGIVDGIQGVVENTGLDHLDDIGGAMRFSNRSKENARRNEVSVTGKSSPKKGKERTLAFSCLRAQRVPFFEGSSARAAKGESIILITQPEQNS